MKNLKFLKPCQALKQNNMKHLNKYYFLKAIISGVVLWLSPIQLMPQANSNSSSPQYLFPEFSKSTVKLKNGQTHSTMMNYNIVSQNMVFEKNDKLMDLMNTEFIDTIFMQNSKFIPAGKFFQEVVIEGPVSFFIQHKGRLEPLGKPAAYGGTSQTSSTSTYTGVNTGAGYYNLKIPDDVVVKVEPVYWIRKSDVMFQFTSKKEFLEIFPDQADKINQFIKKNRIKMYNRSDLIKLVDYCNELMR